jgi:hypothetical protein
VPRSIFKHKSYLARMQRHWSNLGSWWTERAYHALPPPEPNHIDFGTNKSYKTYQLEPESQQDR